jgi:hypothetical protein
MPPHGGHEPLRLVGDAPAVLEEPRPAAVAKARLPRRSTSRTPRRASSSRTCRLTVGCAKFSRLAARVKLPWATTSAIVSR